MELIIELIIWIIIEVVFWGIMFWTGYAITQIVTLGQWKLWNTKRAKNKGKENRKKTKFIVVAIIGVLFWMGLGIVLTIITKSP